MGAIKYSTEMISWNYSTVTWIDNYNEKISTKYVKMNDKLSSKMIG